MEKYLRINSLAVAKAADTSVAPNTNNELKGSGAIDFTAVAEAGDFVLISTGGSNGPAYALDKVVSVTDADELILNTTSTFGIPTGKQFQIYDKDTRRDNIIRCNDIVSIVQIGGARDVDISGSPILGLIYNGIEIQYTGGAMLTIVFEGNDPNETKAGLFLDALINQIETHLQSSATKVMADFVIPPGSEDFVAIQRGSAAVAVS
jgi:microcompartment protein CcmK/EutM